MDTKPEKNGLEQKNRKLEKIVQTLKEKEVKLLERIVELEKTEKYYEALMQNTEDYVLICDGNGIPQAFNTSYKKRTEALLNIEMKPGIQPHRLSNNPESAEYWDSLQRRALKGEKFVAEYYDKERKMYYETLFCPIREGEKIVGFTEITRNITERKLAEEALRESHFFTSSLLENSPNAIIVYDPDTSIRYVNSFFEELTGYTSREVLGLKIPYPWSVDDEKYGDIEERQKKGVRRSERRYRKKNGDYCWAEINVTPIYHDGALSYSLGTWVDITERKNSEREKMRLEKRLQSSQKMESLGLLAGSVAHDLNNVLAGIVSYPDLLLMDLPEDSKFKKPLETIKDSGNRAVAIVQDLLTIARGVAIAKKPINFNNLINDYLKSPEFRQIVHYNPVITINTNLDNSLLNVSGSSIHVRKALMNLISNASEAIEGKGNITISTTNRYLDRPLKVYDEVKMGEYAVLSVSDTGLGIPSEDLDRIFEPFYSKKVMGRSGTGLGLTVVWNVVKEHDGYVNVESNEKGTTFDLYFPITRLELSGDDLEIPIESLRGNGEKILVVDDVESQRDISSRILEKLGYEVYAVPSGEEAVEYLKEHTVDLVLLDMIMDPGINGRETFERILKIRPSQKAIIVSGFSETDEVKKTQRLGAGKYIKKPLTVYNIGTAVKEELEKS
ncbi:MAG: PAS domain S-box protein [Deltaproteobacteria bacterium]|nr:PAS domain S-box protein [Deltaproteobacteria bacterium]